MKKFTLFLAVILLFALTSMVHTGSIRAPEGLQNHPDKTRLKAKAVALVETGMITVKVKKGLNDIPYQTGQVTFNVQSLDKLSDKFRIQSIGKRFRFNPAKMKRGMPDLGRIYRITFPENIPPSRVAEAFSRDPNIEYAEPVPISYPCEEPNDPYYSGQHFLPQIMAEEAWDIHKGENGSEEVIIGIMDTGVEWYHDDLRENIWNNLGEDADGDGSVLEYDGAQWIFDPDDENGIDDDGNGYIDDFIGWDFYNNNNDPDPEPGEDHGTHCAGLAAARTNNGTGVAGISWNLKILPVEDPTFADAYQGIIYAAENGADIVSNSWAGKQYSDANLEAVQYALGLGCIVVASAGNDDNYLLHHYPSSYPGVISVASVSKWDIKATYSNFGPNITVSAPGGEGGSSGLFSTVPNNGYDWKAGTSMASPVMAGLLGLVKSYNPDWINEDIIMQVLGTADNIDSLNPGFIDQLGAGRINAYNALSETVTELPLEIKMDLFSATAMDLDGNGQFSAGDTLTFDIVLQNFSLTGYDPTATFNLLCNDEEIDVIEGSHTDTIVPDNYFTLSNVFKVVIDESATTHVAEFCLTASSTVPILHGDSMYFETLVAPDGIIVYRGEGSGNAYSGEYIKNYLENNGHEVFYTMEMPGHLKGFDAAFITLGNYGEGLDNGTWISDQMIEATINYLEDGGNLFLECGTFLGFLDYFNSPFLAEVQELFSIADIETPLTGNPIDSLFGIDGSIAQDLYFTGTSQSPYWYIDILTPDENGMAMLEENGYGVVAVQGVGEFGQKTVLMAYALSKLQAGEAGMTVQLMENVCEYLGIEIVGTRDVVQGSKFKVQGYPNPVDGDYHIAITLDGPANVSWEVWDMLGNRLAGVVEGKMPAGEYTFKWDAGKMKKGIYFCRVQAGNGEVVMKVVKQ